MYRKGLFLFLFIFAFTSNALAIKVEGTFTAVKACPAYRSFKKGHNPGDIHTIPGRTYDIVEENKFNGPWALVLIPELSDARRWVSKECGTTDITDRQETHVENHTPPSEVHGCNVANTYDSYVLALSWQAGFCEHYHYSGVKPECDNLNSGQISVRNITIHGLWPNKSSCKKSYGNCPNAPLNLTEETISKISPWMPNRYYSSDFGNHEWSKHGTCQELDDDEYFLLIQRLAEKFDRSPLGDYMRDNIGRKVHVNDMETFLDSHLGEDVTGKIELRCTGNGNRFIDEFWINLPKKINDSGTLDELVAGAKNTAKFKGNCAEEIYIEAPGPN